MTLFASLVYDRMPLMWQNLPDALCVWLQNAGGVAAFGVLLVLLSRTMQRDAGEKNLWHLPGGLQVVSSYLAYIFAIPAIAYTIVVVGWIGAWFGFQGAYLVLPRTDPLRPFTIGDWLLTVGGAVALMIAVTPIAIDLCTRIRWGRIWAIARLELEGSDSRPGRLGLRRHGPGLSVRRLVRFFQAGGPTAQPTSASSTGRCRRCFC